MRVDFLQELTNIEALNQSVQVVRAPLEDLHAVEQSVRLILESVLVQGDVGLKEAVSRFDLAGAALSRSLRVAETELQQAAAELTPVVQSALNMAITNIALVADATVCEDQKVSLPQGHTVLVRELPVDRAAVYVPAGRAPYLSTLAMGVVTARAAGVKEVAVAASPNHNGDIHPAILGACGLCGITEVYRMGGAQAIAALAYGTESVKKVDVIVGPGNNYVQVAKRFVADSVGIDGFAGPSDLIVFAQETADVELIALDLLAQAEHGPGSIVICTSTSFELLCQVEKALKQKLIQHSTNAEKTFGGCFLVPVETVDLGFMFINQFAPEHLQLIGEDLESNAAKVRTAGCIFVGQYTPATFGDYVVGSNHVLPTAGAARFASMLGPRHFRRQMAEVRVSAQAAEKLAPAGSTLAELEGFLYHRDSMQARS